MKTLNNFIIEKLKINSKTKLSDNVKELADEIFYVLWGFTDEDPEIYEVISTWIKDNNIKEVTPVADFDALKDAAEFLDDSTVKEYNTKNENVEECVDLLSKSKKLYHKNEVGINLDIYGCDKIICVSGYYGTLYCADSNIIKK